MTLDVDNYVDCRVRIISYMCDNDVKKMLDIQSKVFLGDRNKFLVPMG